MDAVDSSCCCFPTLGVIAFIVALSVTAVVRRSGGFIALAFWICTLLGLGALRPVFYPEDRDGFSNSLLWMWAASFGVPIVATVALRLQRKTDIRPKSTAGGREPVPPRNL
jgi:hypothetical protein